MASPFVAQMIRAYDEFISAIYRECGQRQFTVAELKRRGVVAPIGCTVQKLSNRGVVELVGPRSRYPCTWRLSPQVVEHYAARTTPEVTA